MLSKLNSQNDGGCFLRLTTLRPRDPKRTVTDRSFFTLTKSKREYCSSSFFLAERLAQHRGKTLCAFISGSPQVTLSLEGTPERTLAVVLALQVVSSLLRGIKKGMLTVKLWDDIFLQCFLTFFSVIPRERQACLTKYWLDYQDQALLTDLCFVRRPLLFILDC